MQHQYGGWASRTTVAGLCLCLLWEAGIPHARAQHATGPQYCNAITSVDALQPVIDASAPGESVCIQLSGRGGTGCVVRTGCPEQPRGMLSCELCAHCRGWSLHNEKPMSIKSAQKVIIDCDGNEFASRSNQGNLTMARGSALRYVNCHLLQYEFPDTNKVYGSVHAITSSIFGMSSCRVRPATPPVHLPSFPKHCAASRAQVAAAANSCCRAVRTGSQQSVCANIGQASDKCIL